MVEVCFYKTKVRDKYANIIFQNLQTQRIKFNRSKLRKWNRHLFVTGMEGAFAMASGLQDVHKN
jgi:glutathione peroxidase-family protein